MMYKVILILLALVFILAIYIGIRNCQVFRYRQKCLNIIHQKAMNDLEAGKAWEWRYDALNEVSYDTMMIQFWKLSLRKFYRSTEFMDS